MNGNLMADMLDLMIQTDAEECYERIICDIASKDEVLSNFGDFLAFFSDDEELYVLESHKSYYYKLRDARLFGDDVENIEECEEKYSCPFSGEEMSIEMKEMFPEDIGDY